jgi:hypothetical protein
MAGKRSGRRSVFPAWSYIYCQPGFSRLSVCHQFQLVECGWEKDFQPGSAGFWFWPSGALTAERINPYREARLEAGFKWGTTLSTTT